jgi:hypothetical protein
MVDGNDPFPEISLVLKSIAPQTSNPEDSSDVGVIVGVVVGVVAFIGIAGVLVFFLVIKKGNDSESGERAKV